MPVLELILAPHPIYKTRCTPVEAVTDSIRSTLEDMMETAEAHDAIGLGAPMVGLTQRLAVVRLEQEGRLYDLRMINPIITQHSDETRTREEASITFPDLSVSVTRPAEITLQYTNPNGVEEKLIATGLLATCIQHELDYLDGRSLLDYLSPLKRDMAIRRMKKASRHHNHHVHSDFCQH